MRTPNTFQIGSTTYTTREYCNARGITDNATILKIQWRINTYTRNHTIQQTIEELDRLTLHQEPSDKTERYIATDLGKELYAKTQANKEATTAMKQTWIRRALERTSPEINVRPLDILQSPKNQPNDIKTAITQCAEAIRTVSRLEKELGEAQNTLERLKTITANLLNGETSDDRTKRFNQ
jgi:hypothetical protein